MRQKISFVPPLIQWKLDTYYVVSGLLFSLTPNPAVHQRSVHRGHLASTRDATTSDVLDCTDWTRANLLRECSFTMEWILHRESKVRNLEGPDMCHVEIPPWILQYSLFNVSKSIIILCCYHLNKLQTFMSIKSLNQIRQDNLNLNFWLVVSRFSSSGPPENSRPWWSSSRCKSFQSQWGLWWSMKVQLK